jgi:ATP-dependent RNA helicase DeaD
LNFKDLGINESVIDSLKKLNIVDPTPVQKKAIPLILKNRHIMVQARTGSGKTLAYLLPLLEKMDNSFNETLILVPTRELATQVYDVVSDIGDHRIRALTIYGGVSIANQIRELKKGVHLVVGTPGRIIDLFKRRELQLQNIKFVVLDEGDRLWDMGFAPDVKYILNKIQTKYQFMLFSATLPSDIRNLIKKYSKNNFEFLNLSQDQLTVGNTRQFFYMIDRYEQKYSTFLKVIHREKPEHILVFVNTKKTAKWLGNRLEKEKNFHFRFNVISGNLSQAQREKVLSLFRDHKINLLIATDVAARGLDIDNISHVINYDVPKFPDNYVHRIGRTSRMNKPGVAITLCLKDEYEYLCHIEGVIEKEIKQKFLENNNSTYYHNPFY